MLKLKFSSRFLTTGLTPRFNNFNGSLHNNNLSSSSYADVVVAGGGMVGSAAAAALAKLECMQNRKIILLEAAPEKKN